MSPMRPVIKILLKNNEMHKVEIKAIGFLFLFSQLNAKETEIDHRFQKRRCGIDYLSAALSSLK